MAKVELSGADQKAVKTTAFDLQLDQSSPGLRFHKLDRARDAYPSCESGFVHWREGADIGIAAQDRLTARGADDVMWNPISRSSSTRNRKVPSTRISSA
jgi:hypothetical protein